jgi:hypothetical protein
MRSVRRIVIIQKLPFGRRRRAAKGAIAMREPPEFLNDVTVLPRVAQLLRIIELLEQSYTAILIEQRLGMHERQIEEVPHRQIHRPIEAARECAVGHGAGHRIRRKRARIVAKHVARKLIEQEHERKGALPAVKPGREPASRRILVHGKESGSNAEVERAIEREPFVRPGFAPESHNFSGRNICSHDG